MRSLFDYARESGEAEQAEASAEELQLKQEEILAAVNSFSTNTVRDRVAWILNHYPEARDSDITLALRYWETFENDVYRGGPIHPDVLYKLSKLSSLERQRRKIQNEYQLFLATSEVRQRRGTLADDEREKAVEDQPHYPLTFIYLDDSGKTADLLLVAGVWFTLQQDLGVTYKALHDLKYRRKFEHEFHFTQLQPRDLPIYKEALAQFLREASSVSFKFITVPRRGSAKGSDAITDLYYHLIVRGLDYDAAAGRAPLPRSLQVTVDSEGPALDQLRLANLEERLKTAASTQFEGKVFVDSLRAADSKGNPFLQIADMFAGSINRILNRSGNTHNYKDELAEYVFDSLGFSLDLIENERVGDMAVHIRL